MNRKDKYNSSGYLDMTSYLAMRSIERKEHRFKILKNKAKGTHRKRKTGGRHEQKQ